MKNRSDAVAVLFFAFVAVAYFSLLARARLVLCGPEQFFLYHPLQSFWFAQLFQGNLPWLANAVAGDIPLWADPNLAIFYPGNFLYFVFSFNNAWNLSIVLHLVWGQCGIYWLCRRMKLTQTAAFTAALTFLLSAPALAALNSNEVLITSSWVPWILGLTYWGIAESIRKTALASLALSCQWLAGFTVVQLFTLALLFVVFAVAYAHGRSRIIVVRFLLLFGGTLFMTSVQWIPAAFWLPHADTNWLSIPDAGKLLSIYPGWIAVGLFVIGLRRTIVWLASICILLDYFLFQATPVLAYCLALGAGLGAEWIVRRYHHPLMKFLPVLVAAELLIANWHIPQSIPKIHFTNVPRIVTEIKDVTIWNIHWIGTRGALSPLAGLRWGLKYAAAPEDGLLLWKHSRNRTHRMEDAIRQKTNLEELRDGGVAYVISDTDFKHPELIRVKQKATKFLVRRVRPPLSPLVVSDSKAKVQWFVDRPDSFWIKTSDLQRTNLTIHRNALPGWKCEIQNSERQIRTDPSGWMQVEAPPGQNELRFTYRPPGVLVGTALTAIGTIMILVFLIL